MKAITTAIPDVLIIEPKVFGDARGFFFESFNQAKFDAAVGRQVAFVQDNHSRSAKGVLRGLHYQIQQPQGKLVRVVLSDTAEFLYKTTDYYAPAFERCIAWNDPTIGIQWPIQGAPALSAKDQLGKGLAQAECFA